MTLVWYSQGGGRRLSGEAEKLAAVIAGQEAQHVAALSSAIKAAGGTPVKRPTFVVGIVASRCSRAITSSQPRRSAPIGRDVWRPTDPIWVGARMKVSGSKSTRWEASHAGT
jgi:Ferritin-like domain